MPKYRSVWIAATLAYCAVIFYLSSLPHLGESPPFFLDWTGSDKLVHMILYGGLAGLVATGLIRSNGAALTRRALLFGPVIFATLYGASDELHQWFVPPRSCDIFDLFADTIGATIVAGVITGWKQHSTASAVPDVLGSGNSTGLPGD